MKAASRSACVALRALPEAIGTRGCGRA